MQQQLKQTGNDISLELNKLKQDYISKLPKKILLINEIWQKLSHYSWSDEAFASLYRLVHGLTGSGKTFGLDQLSLDASAFEEYVSQLVKKNEMPTDVERKHIEMLLTNISNATKITSKNNFGVHDIAEHNSIKKISKRENKIVYIVDDDRHISLYLSTLLSNAGFQVRTFANPSLAVEYVDSLLPDAVIMDIVFPTASKIAGFEAVREIRSEAGKRVPIVFVSARKDIAARTKALRSGGDAYFTKPLNFSRLLEKLDELTDPKNEKPHRALIVDDDVELSQYHAALLKNAGMETQLVNRPIEVMQHLEQFKPDLVLMDLYMPDYDGFELSTVIRQDSNYVGLPIVFLSSENDKAYHNKAFELNVNEFLVKPASQEILVNTINRQIRLSRKIREAVQKISKTDPNSGLYNRQYFLEKLDVAVACAVKSDQYCALLDISISNVDVLRDKHGIEWLEPTHQQISTIIQACISENDIATQFSDENYFILTDIRDSQNLIALAKSIHKKIDSKRVRVAHESIQLSCNINIIRINEHLSSVHTLLQFAEECVLGSTNDDHGGYEVHEFLPPKESALIELRERINQAMQSKSFQLVYQPIISVEHRSYEKYEVLVRLVDADGKIIQPPQFLPHLQNPDDITKLDRWVVEHAISSLASDNHARGSADLFIKLTGETLHDNMLIPAISNSLNQGGITGETRIIFHVNEKDVSTNLQQAKNFASKMKKINCGFSIDHFGITDNYKKILETIKPDYVKIRSSVFSGILSNEETYIKVQNLINTAQLSDSKIIAASIEDPATLSVLWNMGVRYFQGYFIKEPDQHLKYNFMDAVI